MRRVFFLGILPRFLREIAEKIYERHLFFMEQFIAAGVDQETAEQDACRIEHAISDTSFRKLKEKVQGTD